MKLVFPNGEHAQVLLSHGVNRVGSAADADIRLDDPDIAPIHCEIHVTHAGANLQVPAGGGAVTVNGKPVPDIMALRAGDQVGFAHVVAKFAVVEAVRAAPAGAAAAHAPDEDSGATRVRVNPRFYRPAEVDLLIGDPSKARDKLGWSPTTTLEELCQMMVEADLLRNERGASF